MFGARKWKVIPALEGWLILALAIAAMLLTLLLPDGWLRSVLVVACLGGWAVAMELRARTHQSRQNLAGRHDA